MQTQKNTSKGTTKSSNDVRGVKNTKAENYSADGSLAARMRPKTFEEILWQPTAVATLKGIIKTQKFPGTIILAGEPGLGKTSLAILFARHVNCETDNACGKCRYCALKSEGYEEINMGAGQGIADVRRLDYKSKFKLIYGKKRIFICDEVQSLPGPAEQALLKVIEEPAKKTLFILCTSDLEKMSPAMQRRGTILRLTNAPIDELSVRLIEIAKIEGLDLNNESGKQICYDIADSCNGAIGLAFATLEGILFEIAGSEGSDLKEIVKTVAAAKRNPAERAAVSCCIDFLKLNSESFEELAYSVDSCLELLKRMRLVAMTMQKDSAGETIYNPLTLKDFTKRLAKAKIEYDPEALAPKMQKLLKCLKSIELKMEQVKHAKRIDEKALFVEELRSLVTKMKSEEEDE